MNRRTALATTIAGGAIMLWDRFRGRSIVPAQSQEVDRIPAIREEHPVALENITKSAPISAPATPSRSTPFPTAPAQPDIVIPVAKKTEIVVELPPSIRDIFRNCTQANLVIASQWVGKELADFNSQSGIEDCIDRTWGWKSDIEAVAAPLKINPEVVPWIMPLIFAESKGDEKAENKKSGAKGLCQIMPDTLTHLKQYLKPKTEPNLLDGKENIHLGLEYLDYLYGLIPEPSLALWSYHLGIGNMIKAVGFYYGTDTSSITEDLNKFETAPVAKQRLRDLIFPKTGSKLNLVKMLTSAQVVDGLKKSDAFHDNTQVYVSRIAAASTYFPVRG